MPVPCESQPGRGEGDAGGLPWVCVGATWLLPPHHHPSNPLWHLLKAPLSPHSCTTQGLPSTLVLPRSPASCSCAGAPRGIELMKQGEPRWSHMPVPRDPSGSRASSWIFSRLSRVKQ